MAMCSCCCRTIIIVVSLSALGFTGILTAILSRPFFHLQPIVYKVSNASLLHFNLTNNDTILDYNLVLNITLVNPNAKVGFHFDRLAAKASLKGQTLYNVTLDSFYLGEKRTLVLPALFKGQRPVDLGGSREVSKFKHASDFDIALDLAVKSWFKVMTRRVKRSPRIKCHLNVQLNSNGSSAQSEVGRCMAPR